MTDDIYPSYSYFVIAYLLIALYYIIITSTDSFYCLCGRMTTFSDCLLFFTSFIPSRVSSKLSWCVTISYITGRGGGGQKIECCDGDCCRHLDLYLCPIERKKIGYGTHSPCAHVHNPYSIHVYHRGGHTVLCMISMGLQWEERIRSELSEELWAFR